MGSFNLISLGCAKNLVDSEVILGAMKNAGWQIDDDPETADVLIINTCGFIQEAVEEAIEEILALATIKDEFPEPDKKLVVVGCLVQRYGQQLAAELPEVDLFVGTEGPEKIPQLVANLFSGKSFSDKVILPPAYLMNSDAPRLVTTPSFRGWLKITEGCDNRCSYCMIPVIRGPLRSRTINDVVLEAKRLEKNGLKELSLVAQDSTAYGKDLVDVSLEGLLRGLLNDTNIPWIRLLYLYPSGITDELISIIKDEPRILPYLDVPLQHVNDRMLKAMNRRYGFREIIALFDKLRSNIPDIALRTTFLVGFPGETDKEYLELERFLKDVRLDHVGVFAYANEDGVPAARLQNQVPENVRNERKEMLLNLQAEISSENLKKYVGKDIDVLVEGVSEETDLLLEGRSKYQAPDVDGVVYINDGTANPGDIVRIRVTETAIYDLVGGIEPTA